MKPTKAIMLTFVIITTLFGCSHTPTLSEDNRYSDNFSNPKVADTIFISPIQVNYKGLDDGEKIVRQEMSRQLNAAGWDVATMRMGNYLDIFYGINDSIDGLYSPATGRIVPEKYEYALTEFVKTINDTQEHAVTLVPSFELKTATLKGRAATWDGVRRKHISDLPGTDTTSWSGHTRGLSMKIMAFSADGTSLFTSYGGLVLPFQAALKDGDARMEIRENLFEEKENIAAGVRSALLPLLGETQQTDYQ